MLAGFHLVKDPSILEAAYNDAAGVPVECTLYLLVRLNRALGADVDLAGFRHRAHYNPLAGRIETCIVSDRPPDVHVSSCVSHFLPSGTDSGRIELRVHTGRLRWIAGCKQYLKHLEQRHQLHPPVAAVGPSVPLGQLYPHRGCRAPAGHAP